MTTPKLETNRRALIGSASLGAVMLGAFAGKAQAADWTAQEKANVQVVNDFLHATKPKDTTGLATHLAPDCVYRMTETTPPDKGFDAIVKRLARYVDNAEKIDFQILATYAAGPIVINHRIDTFTSKVAPLLFEGVGVFFLKDGKIKEWTDYTLRAVV